MAENITFTKQSDDTWQGSFTSTGTRTVLQVVREENAPLFLKISLDEGLHNVIYQPPRDYKDQILSIDIAEGALITVVSHSAVTKASYIASELEYYTKDEIDDMMAQIHQFEPVVAQVLPTASEDTMYKIYFIPKSSGSETGNISEEWITIKTETATQGVYDYYWEKIGDTGVADSRLLPVVTSSDNGKVLLVANGAWSAAAVPVSDNILF